MNNITLPTSLASWTLFSMKSSKKRNIGIFFSVFIQIVLAIFFITDIVLTLMKHHSFGTKAIFGYTIAKILILTFLTIINFMIVLPITNKLLAKNDDLKNNQKSSLAKHLYDVIQNKKEMSKLIWTNTWINAIWYSLYFLIFGLTFMLLIPGLGYPVLPGVWANNIIIAFAGASLIKMFLFDNILVPFAFSKEANKYIKCNNVANYLWIILTLAFYFLILIILEIAVYLNIISGWTDMLTITVLFPIIFALMYLAKAMIIIAANKENKNKNVYLAAFLVIPCYEK
ncbi:hypothetical protein [Metamycoplasma alkalescens]|uniref:Uncharacterized protein n=1 Tax=Metamycoplasma alkalescens TaxID=45363 RepID=A0A318UIR6_9BACT|nr:hypothetical protein [Metamycoplasma alkalescens]PYF42606.1 hypothetical protein BCF88_10812 [Metamycoplasma alkalescens]